MVDKKLSAQRMMNKDGSLKAGEEPPAPPLMPPVPPSSPAAAMTAPAPSAPASAAVGGYQAIWFSRRGVVHIAGLDNGGEVVLRFRTHEIALLEGRMGKGILSMLNEESLGLSFLKHALAVGAAHMFVGKKGKAKRSFNEGVVNSWIDHCEDNGVPFEDLLQAVVKAVVGGMPGGQKYLDAMEQQQADVDDEEDVEEGRPPFPSAA